METQCGFLVKETECLPLYKLTSGLKGLIMQDKKA
jgi:hypothetical protein